MWDKRHRASIISCGLILSAGLLWYLLCLPEDLFRGTCYSDVMTDRNGELLGARTAEDGQWRFPASEPVPDKFAAAIITFEDRYFRSHPGVNPVSLAKAAFRNIKAGHVVSGGSTITMQVIRLSRQKERTVMQKIIECILATRLEMRCSKDEILALYAAHAPFGGNVVGLEAASWRYFGRPADGLSWGETATLAVLPNAPSMIHPGKNRELLKDKRDRLLTRLEERGIIDSVTCALACSEPLPDKPLPMPQYAPHLMDMYANAGYRHVGYIRTSIDIALQQRADAVLERWNREFSTKGIRDLAAVIMDTRTGETIAYCGNTGYGSGREGCQVDILQAKRSTGSILKPILYCALLQDGTILPNTLLPDIPVNINGFSPQNYDLQFYGAVPASEALARSLNVPAVHALRQYGVPKFMELLEEAGLNTLDRTADDYGLSLILGGAEGRLYEITSAYARLAATLQYGNAAHPTTVHGMKSREDDRFPLTDKVAIWWTMDSLKEVNRPDEMDWRLMPSVRKVAWKTGTSYGFRDAWAVGVTPEYAVGVWAGNADGKGVPGLSGATVAGPVMFDLFNLLPQTGWFREPVYGEYLEAEVCRQSGHLKSIHCEDIDTLHLPLNALRSAPCPYHHSVRLTSDMRYRTNADDADSRPMNMFLLPPAMEWYYRRHHPEYLSLPPARPGVAAKDGFVPMEFIYPESGSSVEIPGQLDGSVKGIVCSLAHSNPDATVYWHLDGSYLGCTKYVHSMTVNPEPGPHTITAVDSDGNTLSTGIIVETTFGPPSNVFL